MMQTQQQRWIAAGTLSMGMKMSKMPGSPMLRIITFAQSLPRKDVERGNQLGQVQE